MTNPTEEIHMTTTDLDYTPERAVEVLSPDGGYLWHSGGGIMLARVDFAAERPAEDWPYVLVNDARDVLGEDAEGWYIGFYPSAEEDDASDAARHYIARDPETLRFGVGQYREIAAADPPAA